MKKHADNSAMTRLDPFIGEWSLPGDGRTVFEWLPGRQFLVQRWEVPVPEVPDGIAIIGFAPGNETYLQHYFDSRGVARIYEMSFSDGVWELWRGSPDFSPLDFRQRFRGASRDDGKTIAGRWESSRDGLSWEHDFDLTYTKVS